MSSRGRRPRQAKKEDIMKKVLFVAAVTVVVLAMAGGAFAAQATQQNVTINATVKASCGTFGGGPLSLSIDPATGSEVDSTGTNVTVQCTKSTPFTMTAASAGAGGAASATSPLNGQLTAGGLNNIPYSLYFTTGFTGAGFGAATPQTLITAAGSSSSQTGAVVIQTDAQAAQAGTYSDTVTLTISY